ncbi:MAG TPA: gamma carbonic anhydrase family protein [Acetobacteraceae bacterium]|nr:gamma carbonic anhydrase family protein [Acetobacteraceae bacterium]
MPELHAIGRGPLYTLDGISPRVDATAFIAPTAAVIGDVEIGPESGVWFACVVRGDTNFIRIGARTNVQDGSIIHVDAVTFPTIIGDDVTIGHGAIIHACTLHDRAFVGMGSTVLDGAVIEAGGMLGAAGLLTPGKVIGPNELWTGAPARLKRVMTENERQSFDRNAAEYRRLAARYRAGFG